MGSLSLSRSKRKFISCNVVFCYPLSSRVDLKSRVCFAIACCSDQVLVEVLGRVFVGGENVERVTINLHVSSDSHVSWRDKGIALVDVLVLALVEELALDNATVLLRWLVDANVVVSQVEGDDKPTVNIFWDSRVELGGESEDLFVVVHGLEEVNLGSLWDQLVHLSKGVHLITKAIVGRRHRLHWLRWLRKLHRTEREVVTIPLLIELLSEGIDSVDHVDAPVSVDVRGGCDFIAGQIVVTNEVLTWLVYIEAIWQLLAAKQNRKGVTTVVRVVALTNFESVISQVVVYHIRQVIASGEEAENATVVVQELLLRINFAATEALFHEVAHFWVIDARLGDLGLFEVVAGGP